MTNGIGRSLKIMIENYRGHPWNKGLGLGELIEGLDIILLVKSWEHIK